MTILGNMLDSFFDPGRTDVTDVLNEAIASNPILREIDEIFSNDMLVPPNESVQEEVDKLRKNIRDLILKACEYFISEHPEEYETVGINPDYICGVIHRFCQKYDIKHIVRGDITHGILQLKSWTYRARLETTPIWNLRLTGEAIATEEP